MQLLFEQNIIYKDTIKFGEITSIPLCFITVQPLMNLMISFKFKY